MIGTCCILDRAPRTKETLPDFHEWCRVTRHPRIFRGLMSYQRDTPGLGRHRLDSIKTWSKFGSSELDLSLSLNRNVNKSS